MFTSRDKIKYETSLIIPDLVYPCRSNGEWWKVLLTIITMALQFTYLDGHYYTYLDDGRLREMSAKDYHNLQGTHGIT